MNELTIIFPDEEEKIIFMRWFKEKGFISFIKEPDVFIEFISDYKEFYGDDLEESKLSLQNSYIELQ
jgi:hypothetical protein